MLLYLPNKIRPLVRKVGNTVITVMFKNDASFRRWECAYNKHTCPMKGLGETTCGGVRGGRLLSKHISIMYKD